MSDKLRQIREFDRRIRERSSTKVLPFEYGTAYVNLDFPISYAHNFLYVDRPTDSISAAELAEIADRILGGEGLGHRNVWVEDDELGQRLSAEFEAMGWDWRDHLVIMAFERDPDRVADTSNVEEVSFETIRPAIMEMTSREPWANSEEEVIALADRRTLTAAATRLRHFILRSEGMIASVTDLYSDGRIAQIEDVGTLEEFRGRGYARAVVTKALEVARSEGHELIWIVADDNDWPKDLYRKLGFVPIARYWEFTRPNGSRRDITRS
jgi:ribosomal protein S18 acetylase RimI-like enzyme